MAPLNRPTRDPEVVALGILALRSYAAGTPSETQFVQEISNTLRDLDVSTATAARLIANFDEISPSIRRQEFGSLGLSDAELPANVNPGSRTSNALARREVLRPGAVAPLGAAIDVDGAAGVSAADVSAAGISADGIGEAGDGDLILAPERFTISYQGMHCVDETGADFLGSDEIYILTSAVHINPNGTNVVRTERHPLNGNSAGVYGDVDSHETRIGPVASCWSARVDDMQQGMSLTTVVMEHDQGDPDAFRDEVDSAVKLAIAAATYFFPPGGALLALVEASGLITDIFNWLLGTGDDEVGTVTVVLESLDDLETFSRTRRSSLRVVQDGKQVNTNLPNHFLAPVSSNDYFVGYVVTRDPEAPFLPIDTIID